MTSTIHHLTTRAPWAQSSKWQEKDWMSHFGLDLTPQIEFKANFPVCEIAPGTNIHPADAASPPLVQFQSKPDELYTLAMVDPDAPYPEQPTLREWRHWLVVNIPGGDFSKGLVLSRYTGPSPPPDSPPHRYYFVLFKQPGGYLEESPMNDTKRAAFNLVDWAGKHNLGQPIGWTWFLSSNQSHFKVGEAKEKKITKPLYR